MINHSVLVDVPSEILNGKDCIMHKRIIVVSINPYAILSLGSLKVNLLTFKNGWEFDPINVKKEKKTFDTALSKSRNFYGLLISCKATEYRGFTKLKSKFSIGDVETNLINKDLYLWNIYAMLSA